MDNPLIVQGDRSLLLDVHSQLASDCRAALLPFAELEKSPEHLHTYRLTPLSLWNACAAGFSPDDAVAVLQKYAKFEVPPSVIVWIKETASRFGAVLLTSLPEPFVPEEEEEDDDDDDEETGKSKIKPEYLYLYANNARIKLEIASYKSLAKILTPFKDGFVLLLTDRGTVKEALLKLGYPVKDEAPLRDGDPFPIALRKTCASGGNKIDGNGGEDFVIRPYQNAAAECLVGNMGPGSGFGVIVLPCGSGKTVVGMKIMSLLSTNTLILTTNITALRQWRTELLDKTTIDEKDICEYSGEKKDVGAITIATYQVLTWRLGKTGPYPHFELFRKRNWGLIIYDEVHLLPAPVFRVTAELQAVRRAGLTATLIREDGLEGMVFSLVGPKRYDAPWKELETAGWISKAECIEVRLDLASDSEVEYAVGALRARHRVAGENPVKIEITRLIVEHYPDDCILVIGHFIEQLEKIAAELNAPLITGKMPYNERDRLYSDFRKGITKVLVVSKVANFAIDLPDASMAIQVSGTFGSRQEEAQRLGRILRPKQKVAKFFTLVTRGTVEEDYAANRQKFLAEQGYEYRLVRNAKDIFDDPND